MRKRLSVLISIMVVTMLATTLGGCGKTSSTDATGDPSKLKRWN